MKNKILISLWFIPVIILLAIVIFNAKGGDNMARIKISELNARTEAADSDLIPIVDTINSETKKITKGNLINDVYSTAEVKTNKRWIDGKPIYRKVVNIGDFTDASRYTDDGVIIETGITNFETLASLKVIGYIGTQNPNFYGYMDITRWTFYSPSNNDLGLMEFQIWEDPIEGIIIVAKPKNHFIPTEQNVTNGYAYIEYTKTTD